jgi:hypothetical protein
MLCLVTPLTKFTHKCKWIVYFQTMYSMWPKVLAHVKKIPIYSTKTIFFQKKYCEVISRWILTNFTPTHAELSIFWLFIYSLCCYEWFLFVHNLNQTNKNWLYIFYIFQLKTRKNCFRYLKFMSPLNAGICTTISCTLWVECYF